MHRAAVTLTSLIGLLAAVPAASAHATAAPPTPAMAISGLPANVPPAALRPEPSLPVPLGWPFPDAFPHTSGTFRLVGGALEWSDFLYDDHGAAGVRVAPPLVPLAPTYGTYVYPDGAAHGDGADVFRAAVGLDDGGLQGLGAAIVLASALAIVMNMFEESVDRNWALGIRGALMASGVTVGLIAQPGARCVPAEHRSLVEQWRQGGLRAVRSRHGADARR